MGRKLQESPEKHCAYCGELLERKRFKSSIEDMGRFKKRKYCNKVCFANSLIQEEVTLAGYRARAKKFRKDICEVCGSKENLSIHHIDRDITNNKPGNIATLCTSCHIKKHWEGYRKRTIKKICRLCDKPSKAYGLCQKHYFRWKRHGDPEYKKGSHGQSG